MSQVTMRAALQAALTAAVAPMKIRWLDNDAAETTIPSPPYVEATLLPNQPRNDEFGAAHQDVAIFQVTVCRPIGEGPGASDQLAEQIRAAFPRGTTLVFAGDKTVVERTPQIFRGYRDGNAWRVPVSIPVYSNN